MRAVELADRLGRQAEAVARLLIPRGRRVGSEWRAGDIDGEAGESLGIHLVGEKAGVWSDFSTGQAGDLIGLWMAVKRMSLRDACREASQYLGIPDDGGGGLHVPSRNYRKPSRDGVQKLSDAHMAWLVNERLIPAETIETYRLASRGDRLMFPYLRDGELVFAKYRKLPKQFSAEGDCEPILFGWQAIKPDARALIIAEGECFPGDAQVLTRTGWVELSRYRGGEVAQYRGGSIEWVHPLARIEKPYSGDLLRYETRGYVSVTTPGHNLVSIDHKGREYKHRADDGANSCADRIPRVGRLDGSGIALTDVQIQFCIAVSADAAIDVRKQAYAGGASRNVAAEARYARFGFKKQRKVERLRGILGACGLVASDTAIADGYRSICLPLPEWVPGRLLPWDWIADASLAQRETMLAEIVHWDGNSVRGRNQSEYSSKYLKNAEWVQALAHSTGRVSSIIRRHNEHGAWFKVSILHGKKTTSWQSLKNKSTRVPYDGKVYCVQVPSGMLVVRQEERITITGNCDAMAWHAYGFPALSVPTGANGHKWIEGEFERLSPYDQIFLSFDMDEAGQKSIRELSSRLGAERVRAVMLPHKDANECRMQGVTQLDMAKCLQAAKTIDPVELRNAGEFENDVAAELTRVDEGYLLPWSKTHKTIKLRPGEVSVWAGINGHGKSQIVSDVTASLVCSGVRACVASMEWRTPKWLLRMVCQIGAVGNPTESYARQIVRRLSENLWTFDVAGSSKANRIHEVMEYAFKRYDVRLFVIDNLTKCGFADDDYSGQKKFVEALADFARRTGAHVILVAHMRKGESEDHFSGKFGVKGSGGITDMVATVIEVWRNKAREQALQRYAADPEHFPLPPKFDAEGERGMDAMLIVHKQNANGEEPQVRLWFDKATGQFLGSYKHRPRAKVSVTHSEAA